MIFCNTKRRKNFSSITVIHGDEPTSNSTIAAIIVAVVIGIVKAKKGLYKKA